MVDGKRRREKAISKRRKGVRSKRKEERTGWE